MTLNEAVRRLWGAGIESAEYDARELFIFALGLPRSLPIDRKKDYISDRLDLAIEERVARKPLQYILGTAGFFREEYIVNESVLIPRYDTETLVEYAVKNIPAGESFADICCGCGCIAISTLKNTAGTTATAFDISAAALAVAKLNAQRLLVSDRLTLLECDIMSYEPRTEQFFAVLSNPPYVSSSAYDSLEPEIFAEPKIAHVGGSDGGDFYRALVPIAKRMIKPDGFAAFEIGYDQRELLASLAIENGMLVEFLRDLGGNDRVAVMRKK